MTLELKATPEDVMRAVEALWVFGQSRHVPEKVLFGLAVALEESGSNIVNHGLRHDPAQTFHVILEHTGSALSIELRDRGPEFDPTRSAPVVRAPGDDPETVGGWGLQLIRQYTDELRYRRENGENIFRFTKQLAPAQRPESLPEETAEQTPNPHIDMPLEIQIQKEVGPKNTGAVTVKLTGSLDTVTAPDLERQLSPVLATGLKDLVFDLAQLKFISSAGLRVFATARKQLKERGGQASFIHMQPQIQEVFEIIKSLPGVAIFKDTAEMDRYLAARQRSYDEPQS